MAKADRCLASEHPRITEPGQWIRQACAGCITLCNNAKEPMTLIGLRAEQGHPISGAVIHYSGACPCRYTSRALVETTVGLREAGGALR
ncbi:MAG: hypothetical protein ACYCO9_23290 [Streptosporangiaceae bacterium]